MSWRTISRPVTPCSTLQHCQKINHPFFCQAPCELNSPRRDFILCSVSIHQHRCTDFQSIVHLSLYGCMIDAGTSLFHLYWRVFHDKKNLSNSKVSQKYLDNILDSLCEYRLRNGRCKCDKCRRQGWGKIGKDRQFDNCKSVHNGPVGKFCSLMAEYMLRFHHHSCNWRLRRADPRGKPCKVQATQ